MLGQDVDLEEVLARVGKLGEDLEAYFVREEEGHFEDEEVTDSGWWPSVSNAQYGPPPTHYEKVWVVDKPALKIPDNARREKARQGVQEIYDFCDQHYARHRSGMYLERYELDLLREIKKLCGMMLNLPGELA